MRKKLKFNIGDWVVVRATAQREYLEDSYKCVIRGVPLETGLWGRLSARRIGRRVRTNQVSKPTRVIIPPGDGYEPPYFTCDKTVIVWLVRLGVTNKPLEALEADLTQAWSSPNQVLPWRYAKLEVYSQEYRRDMRDALREMKRDSRGRLLKKIV